ncbi:MAG: hypothetical protein NXH75_13970, partial [Halobacteriovoraceae bacterium]|nr:hypothetical protein [Halobacteriovoraceae bacterium]
MSFSLQLGLLRQIKKINSEESGEILLLLILFLGSFAMTTAIFHKKLLLYNEELKQREQTYLCLKKSFDSYQKLLQFIDKTNLAIKGINVAILLKPTPELFQLKKVIQKTQDIKGNIVFLKAIKGFGCKGLQKVPILNVYPLQKKGVKIKRNFQGLALKKRSTKKFILPSKRSYPFLFTLTGK